MSAPLFTLAEIVRKTGRHRHTIEREFRSGRLPGTKIGSQWCASYSDLLAWLGGEDGNGNDRVRDIFGSPPVDSKNGEPVAASEEQGKEIE